MTTYATMPNFGSNSNLTKEDSSKYSESSEINAISEKTESGYSITRARFKQPRRRTFETAFTNLRESEKLELQDFEEEVGGIITPFYWRNPQSLELILVQFMEPLKFSYSGTGVSRRWNVSGIKLREV